MKRTKILVGVAGFEPAQTALSAVAHHAPHPDTWEVPNLKRQTTNFFVIWILKFEIYKKLPRLWYGRGGKFLLFLFLFFPNRAIPKSRLFNKPNRNKRDDNHRSVY